MSNPTPMLALPANWPSRARALNEKSFRLFLEKVDARIEAEIPAGAGWRARYDGARRIILDFAPEIIARADEYLDLPWPEQKKRIREVLLHALQAIEKRVDLAPALIEPILWRFLGHGLGKMIEAARDQLEAKNVVGPRRLA